MGVNLSAVVSRYVVSTYLLIVHNTGGQVSIYLPLISNKCQLGKCQHKKIGGISPPNPADRA